MKKLLVLFLLAGFAYTVYAYTRPRPVFRPDWTFQAPRPGNGTYLYVVEQGEGNTQREARTQALGRVFQSTANRLGQAISTYEINQAVQAGSDFEVIAQNMKVPINKVCEFSIQNAETNTWTMYVLCQVAKAGNIQPEFETTGECTKHERFDNAMNEWEEEQKSEVKHRNTTAIVASSFIPGMGQMLKGQYGSGTAFLVSEIALFGGGTTCYFLGQEQHRIMKDTGTSYADYQKAKNTKKTLDIAMWTCFGVGIAVHASNMVHAWYVKDKHLPVDWTFAPAIIPTNDLLQPSYAYGAGVQIKF